MVPTHACEPMPQAVVRLYHTRVLPTLAVGWFVCPALGATYLPPAPAHSTCACQFLPATCLGLTGHSIRPPSLVPISAATHRTFPIDFANISAPLAPPTHHRYLYHNHYRPHTGARHTCSMTHTTFVTVEHTMFAQPRWTPNPQPTQLPAFAAPGFPHGP